MPAYFKIDKQRSLVISTMDGVFSLADGLAHQEKLLKDPDFAPNFRQLLDCTHVAKLEIKPEEMRTLARRAVFTSESRRAILVRSDLAFGLGRMFLIFREIQGEKGVRVFRDRDEAVHWLFDEKSGTLN
jgi:hypothetical protein